MAPTYIYEKQQIKLFLSKINKLLNKLLVCRKMLSQIGLIHLFSCPCNTKAAKGFLFLFSLLYQGHTNKQLASLADSCITH